MAALEAESALVLPPSRPFSEEARTHMALQHLNTYLSQTIDDTPFVAKGTLKERDRLWENWTRFCSVDLKIDSLKTWLRFVEHPETAEAQAPFRAFLRTYAETPTQKRVVLGPDEYEYKRTVNSAFSLTEVWRRLVASGEHHIMRQQRKEDCANKEKWRLRWISKEEGSREGPAYRIVKVLKLTRQWIFVELATEIGLDTTSTYQKIEMTSTDIDVLLGTLWLRSSDISCKPDTRVSFHAIILLAAIGGFRPGTLLNLTYSQFQVAVVRDPEDRTRKKIVVTIYIKRNKVKETAKTSRARNGGCIGFSITLVPKSSFCLASLVLVRAIQENAFDPSFNTVNEIFDRPDLESTDFIPLKWRQDILEQRIFPMVYNTLNELWHRTLLVAGFREQARFYSLRVGAGARLDGVLSDALRNYVLSHTTNVVETSYQSHRVRANLMSLAFGDNVRRDDLLFAKLRDISMSRDANAPVAITSDEESDFEKRQDVSCLRNEINTANGSREKTNLRAKLCNLLKTLSQLKLEDKRVKYFEHVDQLRAKGIPTTNYYAPNITNDILSSLATANVSQLIMSPIEPHVKDGEFHSKRYISSLLGYLTNTPVTPKVGEAVGKKDVNTDTLEMLEVDTQKQPSRCLVCQKPFSSRSTLTKHCKAQHTNQTTFSRPFSCRECQALGLEEFTVDGPCEWSNHVERVHGKRHAPNWNFKHTPTEQTCTICTFSSTTMTGLLNHMNRHLQSSDWPVSCLACAHSRSTSILLKSKWEWLEHLKTFHIPFILFCNLCGYLCSATSGLTRHISCVHSTEFEGPFRCPICERQGAIEARIINGLANWHVHVTSAHSEWDCVGSGRDVIATQVKHSERQRESSPLFSAQLFQDTSQLSQKRRREPDEDEYDEQGSRDDENNFGAVSYAPLSPILTNSDSTGTRPGVQGIVKGSDEGLTYDTSSDGILQCHIGGSLPNPQLSSSLVCNKSGTNMWEGTYTARRLDEAAQLLGQIPFNIPTELIDPALRQNDAHLEMTEDPSECSFSGYDIAASTIQSPDPKRMRPSEDDSYLIDCILERWGKNLFLVKWLDDGSCWWVPRKNILDEELVQNFEASYEGFCLGVEVLRTRTRNRKPEYRVHWKGRPESEDTWVQEKYLSPVLAREVKPNKTRSKRRRRHY